MPRAQTQRTKPAPPPRPARRRHRPVPYVEPPDDNDLAPLSPACLAYLDAMFGPALADHPWIARSPAADLVCGAYLRCLQQDDRAMADAFERALSASRRALLRKHLDEMERIPPSLLEGFFLWQL